MVEKKLKKEIDFLIVGQGISGSCFAWRVFQDKKTFMIIDSNNPNSSSKAALGIFNPITGRNYIKSWKYNTLFCELMKFYICIESKLNEKIIFSKKIYRPFKNIVDNNSWNTKLSSDKISPFIDIMYDKGILTKKSGYLDVKKFLSLSKKYFKSLSRYKIDNINTRNLNFKNGFFWYNNQKFKRVVMCRGVEENDNNVFKNIKLNAVSGNSIKIGSKKNMKWILNNVLNVLPIDNNIFLIGSTYYNSQKDRGSIELVKKTKIKFDEKFKLIKTYFGIRPASPDRRPIIGEHKKNKGLYIFNGMGSKAVSLAPYCSKVLYDYIKNKKNIEIDLNIARFEP
tara:strand:- start:8746 stop:9762 length:1017 start_codon:yes stop_codon:yes gene_type:complete